MKIMFWITKNKTEIRNCKQYLASLFHFHLYTFFYYSIVIKSLLCKKNK